MPCAHPGRGGTPARHRHCRPGGAALGIDRALAEVVKACRAALEEAGLGADALGSVHAAVGLAGVGRKGALEELDAAAASVPLGRLRP